MSKQYTRKATFTVALKNGQRHFTAVNKRAKVVAKKAGNRKYVTLEQLKALKGSGSYKYYAYTSDKALKPIRL